MEITYTGQKVALVKEDVASLSNALQTDKPRILPPLPTMCEPGFMNMEEALI
jgi:hypothetical protein